MSNHDNTLLNDSDLFKSAMRYVKKLKQETIFHKMVPLAPARIIARKRQREETNCSFYFSDAYQPLVQENPVSYCRDITARNAMKRLSRGRHIPEFFLDLHGLTQTEAKKEIAALITVCLHKKVCCACIIYGHGKRILKKQVPRWLAQHPNIVCFNEAPNKYGGTAALLVLLDNECDSDY